MRKEYLSGNKIELGMEIPLIESRISQVSCDKGISLTKAYGSLDHKVIVECVGTVTALQIPLMVIDRRGVSIMSALFANRRVTHLRFSDVSSRYGNYRRLILEAEGCLESRMRS